jgi:hypothetical protein
MPIALRIEPVQPEDIRDPELLALMERCAALGVPDATFQRVLARVPEYAKALLRALLVSHAEGAVISPATPISRVFAPPGH